MTAGRWRRRPAVVDAVQWTGANAREVLAFTLTATGEPCFGVMDERARQDCADPAATAWVLDKLHSTRIFVQDGDWVLRGLQGEYYPCRQDVFPVLYEPAEGGPGEGTPVSRD